MLQTVKLPAFKIRISQLLLTLVPIIRISREKKEEKVFREDPRRG